jgi:heme exporter protein D
MSHFLAMGGYAAYVWSAYGATALAVGLLVWRSLAARARARALLAKIEDKR